VKGLCLKEQGSALNEQDRHLKEQAHLKKVKGYSDKSIEEVFPNRSEA